MLGRRALCLTPQVSLAAPTPVAATAGLTTTAVALDSRAKPMVRSPTDIHPGARELGLTRMDLGVRLHNAESGVPFPLDLSAHRAVGLRKTALHDWHVDQGGKMVPFCGWSMPVQYPLGVLKEHKAVRESAGLFDVSHMCQLRITGPDRIAFIESVTPTDFAEVAPGNAKLSVYTNELGGIMDDTVITVQDDHLYVVVNAGCADKDLAHLSHHANRFDVHIEVLRDLSLLALQGPKAASVLSKLSGEDLTSFGFMSGRRFVVNGLPVYVTRCGYTGEDGFEISVKSPFAVDLASTLAELPEVEPAGLGARDSLRLEAGLCLYGHDINETTTPVEAGLNFIISKRRRQEGGFRGADFVLSQLGKGNNPPTKRVGLVVDGPPAREGATIHTEDGTQIGAVTSGGPSPSTGLKIAQGYVPWEFRKSGTKLRVRVRGKDSPATVTAMPFVPSNYYRVPAAKGSA